MQSAWNEQMKKLRGDIPKPELMTFYRAGLELDKIHNLGMDYIQSKGFDTDYIKARRFEIENAFISFAFPILVASSLPAGLRFYSASYVRG